MKKVLIICGPTATGKTALAVTLGNVFNAELVSADSRHVYKGLDILTGKDLPADGTRIWATDLVDLQVPYSIAQYQKAARQIISDIHCRGKMAILVGGSGLYIRAVVESIDTASVPQNLPLRRTLASCSVLELQTKLQTSDPSKWERMNHSDRTNPRRLVRAIEVAVWNLAHPIGGDQAPAFDVLWIGLTGSLEVLKKNIEQRVRERFAQGVIDEVKSLGTSMKSDSFPASTSLGLSVVRKVIARQSDEVEAVKQWTHEEVAFAKRQLTWFRKIHAIHWFDITQKNYQTDIQTLVRKWYTSDE